MRQKFGNGLAWLALFTVSCLVGCGSGNKQDTALADANQSNIQRLSNLYVMFQMTNGFKGPKDEAAFKTYIASAELELLNSMGVDPSAVDQLFISEGDGEAFNIRYGVPSGTRGSTEAVVFQKVGSAGKRMVGFLNMVQREVDDEEYEQLWNAKVAGQNSGQNRARARGGESRSGT